MRANLGWHKALTRTLSAGAVLAGTAVAAWGQASTPSKPAAEPAPLGNVSHPTEPAPLSDQKTSDQKTLAGETPAPTSQEANGIGPVLGAHFEHGARGTHSELKITAVDPNSPATRAGLQPNDRLIAIDGRSFGNPRQLIAYLSVLGGRPVPVVIERNGRETTVQLFPGQFQGDRAWLGVLLEENSRDQGPAAQNQNNHNQPGSNASAKSPNESPSQNTTAGASKSAAETGAEVSQVYPNGPAARAGLRTGDVILHVNGQKVDDPAELVALVHEMKPQSQAELEVLRDNKQLKVPVTLGSRNQEYMAQFGPGQFGQGGQYGQGQFGPGQGGPPQFGGQYGPGPGGPWQGHGLGQFPQGPGPWQGQAGSNSNEFHQQLRQQNQRIEDELKQLREEIKQLREQLQKK